MRRLQCLARHRKGTLKDLEKQALGPVHGSMECTLKVDIFSEAIRHPQRYGSRRWVKPRELLIVERQ